MFNEVFIELKVSNVNQLSRSQTSGGLNQVMAIGVLALRSIHFVEMESTIRYVA